MLKVELHAHTDEDRADLIAHTTRQLIDHAADLGYDALAVTLHDRYFDPEPHRADAARRGLVLLSGIERTIEGRHMLLINFPDAAARVATFADVRALKARCNGLVVAPHPFFPVPSALRGLLDQQISLIDAVEVNAMFTSWIDFNVRAVTWARAHGKPLVGNTDLHLLEQMGTTFSLVDADRTADSICDAIRAGRVEVIRRPVSLFRAGWTFARMSWGGILSRYRGRR